MDIYNVLKKDHATVKELLTALETAGNQESKERQQLFAKIKEEVLVHSKAEQKVFYNPLERHQATKQKVKHSEHEHQEVENLLEELTTSSLTGAAWLQRCRTLAKSLQHHIEEEENELFKLAQGIFSDEQAQEMGKEMLAAKKDALKHLDTSMRRVS